VTLEAQYGPPRQKDHLSARFCPRRGGVPDLDWICFVCFLDPAFPRYDRMVLVGTYGTCSVAAQRWQRRKAGGGKDLLFVLGSEETLIVDWLGSFFFIRLTLRLRIPDAAVIRISRNVGSSNGVFFSSSSLPFSLPFQYLFF